MSQSLLQPAPFRTPFFATDGQIHEEWRRFFLSNQTLVNLLLQQLIAGTPHPSLVSAEDSDPSDPFIVPGPTGPSGGAGPPGKPGFDGEDGVSLFEAMLHGPHAPFVPTILTDASTGTQNNYAPGINGPNIVHFWAGASDVTINGLVGGVLGCTYTFRNTGSSNAFFNHNNAGGSAGNKLFNAVTSGSTPVSAGGSIRYTYDGTQWQLIAHRQGAGITRAFNAANYTANGGATWTVAAGNVQSELYSIIDRKIALQLQIVTTTISGAGVGTDTLSIAMPGGYTPFVGSRIPAQVINNTITTGLFSVGGIASLSVSKDFSGSVFVNDASSGVLGSIAFDVN